ncbi:hypothetical protein DCAR_0624229 [Daucus carota subsp. sativus]|uniref:Uncharacterized protein n=1 Tax=Daucus carota subsp. sativus TaxID=79200 RepID=A0AAF0XD45_DAUCS|nr:hypothetical protein DCAR_0624229 [Daucus carota subsp. sativus]
MTNHTKFISSVLLLFLVISYTPNPTSSQTIVKALPGFPGELPFKLETGYVEVGEREDVVLFYYFVESERNPATDPLLIWIAGGPGCSTLRSFFFQIGPFTIEYSDTSKEIPDLHLNPYSWTKLANVIFLDAPTSGFSYAKSPETYTNSDTLSAKYTYQFLRKWLEKHPKFISNPLYVTGISYSGITIPLIVQETFNGNEAGNEPRINITGYIIGNPLTDRNIDFNTRIPYAHQVALLSDELYESTKAHCNGEYVNVHANNKLCQSDLQKVDECLEDVYIYQILEPICTPETSTRSLLQNIGSSTKKYEVPLSQSAQLKGQQWCRENTYLYTDVWANVPSVRKALNIREGTIGEWVRCNADHYIIGKNDTVNYAYDVSSTLANHRNFTKKNCRALIISGDHDMAFSHLGTKKWIHSLNLDVDSTWAPWFVKQQVAGYSFSHDNFTLTFATVKGGGHAAQEFKPEECLAMVNRWFDHKPLYSV